MADLLLTGSLDLRGTLTLAAGGKVKAGGIEILVQVAPSSSAQGTGIPVLLPPPPASPVDDDPGVRVIGSFNVSVLVKVKGRATPAVAQGTCIQGRAPTWPGLVLLSTTNSQVTVNQVPLNVTGDSGMTLPNGGSVIFNASGQ